MDIYNGTCGTPELRTVNGPMTSSTAKGGAPSYQEGDLSQGVQVMGREFVLGKLPEVLVAFDMFNLHVPLSSSLLLQDIFDHLYSLVPLEDASRAACVSHGFLRSWRRYPRLILNNKTLGVDRFWQTLSKDTLASTDKRYREHIIESYFVNKIEHILDKRSDIGVKAFVIHLYPCPNMKASYIDKWLRFALKPGIEELAFEMSTLQKRAEYNFPCSLLSNETGGSLQSLRLMSCAFHPRTTLGCQRSLTSLCLCYVHITGEELGHFVSNCNTLVQLLISGCNDIICLRVSGVLWHLNRFHVTECQKLKAIEINAPKLSNFICGEDLPQITLGAEVKHITMMGSQPNTIRYARTKLPSFMPAVERVTVESHCEKIKTPMMSSKFVRLKYLDIYLADAQLYRYDYFCLVSFLDASPALETFVLRIETDDCLRRDSVFRDIDRDQLHLRQMPECWHHNLKKVTVTGFTSAKSLTELTRHIVQNALVLECMTLDTACGCGTRTAMTNKCQHMSEEGLREAQKALEAVRRCIEGIVRPSTNFKVLEPCSLCRCQGSTCSFCR